MGQGCPTRRKWSAIGGASSPPVGMGKAAGLGLGEPRGLSCQGVGLRGQIEVQSLMQSPPVAPVVP